MTKSDYRLVAEVIQNLDITHEVRNKLVLALCKRLAKENPRFSPAMFVEACNADIAILIAL